MRLESLDLYETNEGRAELLELAERLQDAGAEVDVAERDESVHSVLQEDAFHDTVTVLNVVLTNAEHVTFLVPVIKGWGAARRHFGRRSDATPSVDIWSAEDDDVLDRILLPRPGSKWCLGCDEWVLPEVRPIALEASGGDGPDAQRRCASSVLTMTA